jgi:hypothetical protein
MVTDSIGGVHDRRSTTLLIGTVFIIAFLAATPLATHAQVGTSTMHVETFDGRSGNEIEGFAATLYLSGQPVACNNPSSDGGCYTPADFTLVNGQQYTLEVDGYGYWTFDHWSDSLDPGDTNNVRGITIDQETWATAVLLDYGFPTDTAHSEIQVWTWDNLGNGLQGYFTTLWLNGQQAQSCFSPCSFVVPNGNTYQVAVADFGNFCFDHWDDGTTNRFHTVVIGDTQTLVSLDAIYVPC